MLDNKGNRYLSIFGLILIFNSIKIKYIISYRLLMDNKTSQVSILMVGRIYEEE